MKPKRDKSPAPSAEPSGPEPSPAPGADKRMAASTVTLRFDERGEPLEAKPETVERAREWLQKMSPAGPEPEALAPVGPEFVDEKLVGHLLHAVNLAQAGLVRAFAGLPFDQALSAVRFTDKEVAEVAPAAVAVLEKHLPGWLAAHQDLAGLVVILGAIEASKWESLRKLAQERNKEAL